jgi:hypothetical protein
MDKAAAMEQNMQSFRSKVRLLYRTYLKGSQRII